MATQLDTLKAEARRAKLQRQIAEDRAASARLAPQTAALEEYARWVGPKSFAERNIPESWGDLVDPREWMYDGPAFARLGFASASQRDDRKQGRNTPIVQTEADLARIRGVGRLICETSVNAQCALQNLANYVVGTGFEYEVQKRRKKAYVEPDLLEEVQDWLDTFLRENKFSPSLERELLRRHRRDGEFFESLTDTGNGHVQCREVEPEFVTEPDGLPLAGRVHLFGIDRDEEDVQTVYGYCLEWPGDYAMDYLDADRCQHAKANVDRNIARGVSDFYSVYEYLQDSERFVRNTGKAAAIAAAIAWIEQHAPGVTKAQAESLQTSHRTLRYDQTDQAGHTRTKSVRKIDPGTILSTEAGRQFAPSPLSEMDGVKIGAVNSAVLRIVGCRWCMPEFLITGDASNANYSSTTVAEGPWTKFCEVAQVEYGSEFKAIIWKALRLAEAAGRFRRWCGSFGELARKVKLAVTFPRVASRNALEETQRRQALVSGGVLSLKTWAQQEDLDFDEEKEAGARTIDASHAPAVRPVEAAAPTMTQEQRIQTVAKALLWEGYP
jgi:hypothetical protein